MTKKRPQNPTQLICIIIFPAKDLSVKLYDANRNTKNRLKKKKPLIV